MANTASILNTKIATHKDQILIIALTAAITAAVAVPFALAVGDARVSANAPVAATTAALASAPSCSDTSVVSTTAAKRTASYTNNGTVNTQSGNSGSQNANSGQGNANNTTGGSSAANGNNQSNTGGLLGVNAIAPISVLGNTTVSGGEVSALNNPLQGVTASVPALTGALSGLGISL